MNILYLRGFALLVGLVTALSSNLVIADEFSYPSDNPRVSITFPDSWVVEPEGDALHAGPSDKSLYFGLLGLPADITPEKAGETIGGAIDSMVTDFQETESDSFEINGITFFYSDATAKDKESGEDLSVSLAYFSPDANPKHMMAIVYFGTPESEEKHENDLQKVLHSIKNPKKR